MASRQSQNNLLAGILVIGSIIAAVVIIMQLSGFTDRFGKVEYTVLVPLDFGVEGLNAGSIVKVGGYDAGLVREVGFERDESGRIIGHRVLIGVDGDIAFYREASSGAEVIDRGSGPRVVMRKALLGTLSSLDFVEVAPQPAVGTAAEDMQLERIEPGGIIAASRPEGFLESLGLSSEDVGRILADAQRSIERVTEIIEQIEFEEDYEKIQRGIERFDQSLAKIQETVEQGPDIAQAFRDRLEEVRELLAKADREYLEANREDVRAAIQNARGVTEDAKSVSEDAKKWAKVVEDEYLPLVESMLTNADSATRDAADAAADIEAIVKREDPTVREMIANLRLSSDQIRDTLIEVRRSPWRLLYRPSEQESEYELLYDSARLFAGAVTNLKAATTSLESVNAAAVAGEVDAARLQSVREEIERAVERYREAEDVFLERLIEGSPADRE